MLLNCNDEFLSVLKKYNLDKEDVCIVGSSAFATLDILPNNDIDFIVKRRVRDKVFSHLNQTSDLSENVQILFSEKYKGFFGISDDEIINNPRYHTIHDGVKVVRAELEYSARLIMRREKDIKSFPKITDFTDKNPDKWNFQLIKELRKKYVINKIKKILRYFKNKIKSLRPIKIEKYNENILKSSFSYCCYPTEKFLNRQRDKDGTFQGYDVIVRYGFAKEYIENGLDSNNFWYKMYEKMQKCRGSLSSHNYERFTDLIEEYKKNNYDYDSKVLVAKNGYLLEDGSHRTALNLLYNVPFTSLAMSNIRKKTRNYSIKWFKSVGFTQDEISKLEDLKNELFMQKGLYFPVVLWGSVTNFINEICEKHIKKYGNIVSTMNYSFKDYNNFRDTVFKIYSSDDIADWKVEKKLEYLSPYNKEFTIVYVEIPQPNYRKKDLNNHDISTVVEKMKKEIRTVYKAKVDNYFYDIIAHICDNYAQNRIVNKVLKEVKND